MNPLQWSFRASRALCEGSFEGIACPEPVEGATCDGGCSTVAVRKPKIFPPKTQNPQPKTFFMRSFSAADLQQTLSFPLLIAALRNAFQASYEVPDRWHLDYAVPGNATTSTLLLMPAWQAGGLMGVKLVTVSPENHLNQLPAIQGTYCLFDAVTGQALAIMDAPMLTTLRTAAASALAADHLATRNAKSLLMIGTGTLAPALVQAHASIRPIEQVYLWGRNLLKAEKLQALLAVEGIDSSVVSDLATAIPQADIISCATLSQEPLIQGKWLREGQHLDLVGAYKPTMREADSEAILRASCFADMTDNACREGGDFAIPLGEGSIQKDHILSDLLGLCRGEHSGRRSQEEVTCFKSVGHALEDLAAAQLVWENKAAFKA